MTFAWLAGVSSAIGAVVAWLSASASPVVDPEDSATAEAACVAVVSAGFTAHPLAIIAIPMKAIHTTCLIDGCFIFFSCGKCNLCICIITNLSEGNLKIFCKFPRVFSGFLEIFLRMMC
jgi:hypothetical protein